MMTLAKIRAAAFKARWEVDHAPSAQGLMALTAEEAYQVENALDAAAEQLDKAVALIDAAARKTKQGRMSYESALSAIIRGEVR